MGINKKSLQNLKPYPSKKVLWNDNEFSSIRDMSRRTGIPKSTIQDYFKKDIPLKGYYIDEVI